MVFMNNFLESTLESTLNWFLGYNFMISPLIFSGNLNGEIIYIFSFLLQPCWDIYKGFADSSDFFPSS